MKLLKRLTQKIIFVNKDDVTFLHYLKKIEVVVSKVLSLLMVGVILVAVYELIIFLSQNLLDQQPGIFKNTLFQIFGLFLNVLIALEILENITAYLQKHVVQAELVIVTSLIAVSRKIIILDLEKKSAEDLIALAIAVFALAISYLIIRLANKS